MVNLGQREFKFGVIIAPFITGLKLREEETTRLKLIDPYLSPL